MTNVGKKGYAPIAIRIYSREKELLLEDEVLCAWDTRTSKIIAVGKEALQYTEDAYIMVACPTKFGVVAEFDLFRKVMLVFINKLKTRAYLKPKMAVCVPANLTEVEQKAFMESFEPYVRKPFCFYYTKAYAQFTEKELEQEAKKMDYYVEFESEYYDSEYFG